MDKNQYRVLTGILFLVGVCVLLYPAFGNYWNQRREAKLINAYEQDVQAGSEDEFAATFADAEDYNRAQMGNALPDAFAEGEQKIDEIYEQRLNIDGSGLMGYLEIPQIKVQIPVFHGTSEVVLEQGAGHLIGSSLPVGGESTHAVLAAHRGLPAAKLFSDLDLLKNGDVFYMHTLNRILAYEVDQILTVEPSDTGSLAIEPGKDYMTLVTCTPYGVNTMRLLVRGHRIPYEEEVHAAEAAVSRTSFKTNHALAILLGFLAVGIFAAVLHWREKVRNREITE